MLDDMQLMLKQCVRADVLETLKDTPWSAQRYCIKNEPAPQDNINIGRRFRPGTGGCCRGPAYNPNLLEVARAVDVKVRYPWAGHQRAEGPQGLTIERD